VPPRPPLADTVRLEQFYFDSNEVGERLAANIMYCQFVPAYSPSAGDLVNLANAFIAAWYNRMKAFVNLTASFGPAVATLIDGSETQGVATAGGGAATGAGGDMPAQTAAVFSWKIAAAYRGGHPRTYLPFPDKSILAAGPSVNTISAASGAAMTAAADAFLVDMNGFGFAGGVTTIGTVSYRRANAPRVVPVFYPYLGHTRVNERLGTQRRRLGKLLPYYA
jgi:hypothetical protein